jgi:hypothetical protein
VSPSVRAHRALVEAFIAGDLPRAEWTHAAHLVVAVWLIRERGLDEGLRCLPDWIRRYNDRGGVANSDTSGFHATLTVAYLRGTAAVLRDLSPGIEWGDAVDAVLQSPLGSPNWPLAFWSPERLWSVAARRQWIEPDRQPLPAG